MEKATFAAGCFWGVQAEFDKIEGVTASRVGYTGGHTQEPTYREVCSGTTGHAEACELTFDPATVSFEELLRAFWELHDPTTPDRQGPDIGTQYRSAVFFHSEEQERIVKASIAELEEKSVFPDKIVTQVAPATTFWDAEDYHQKYIEKRGGLGSCHVRRPLNL